MEQEESRAKQEEISLASLCASFLDGLDFWDAECLPSTCERMRDVLETICIILDQELKDEDIAILIADVLEEEYV